MSGTTRRVRSVCGSVPTTLAASGLRSATATVMVVAAPTSAALVRMRDPSIATPDPTTGPAGLVSCTDTTLAFAPATISADDGLSVGGPGRTLATDARFVGLLPLANTPAAARIPTVAATLSNPTSVASPQSRCLMDGVSRQVAITAPSSLG